MLAQHYADTAYALPACSVDPAYWSLKDEHTVVAIRKLSSAPEILSMCTKRDVSLHEESFRYLSVS